MPFILLLARGVHRLERVSHESLRAPERARDIEAAVEAAEILRRLYRLLERGLRKTKCRRETLELARIGLRHARIIAPGPYARSS